MVDLTQFEQSTELEVAFQMTLSSFFNLKSQKLPPNFLLWFSKHQSLKVLEQK